MSVIYVNIVTINTDLNMGHKDSVFRFPSCGSVSANEWKERSINHRQRVINVAVFNHIVYRTFLTSTSSVNDEEQGTAAYLPAFSDLVRLASVQ